MIDSTEKDTWIFPIVDKLLRLTSEKRVHGY